MTEKPQAQFAIHALAAALPETGAAPPEWITIFPKLGEIVTRDSRRFIVDGEQLMTRFAADGIDIPIDVNHATDSAAWSGGRSDAVGWISQLRVELGALRGKVEWLDEGKALLEAKKYRFVSPSFHHTPDGRTEWLKAVALVTAPALGQQTALAAASLAKEPPMKEIATALGLAAEASLDAMLSALSSNFVPKATHDEALSKLTAATTELAQIKDAARKAQVDAMIDGAVKEKKILPAQKDHYATLCATDAGLESVKALLAATAPLLGGSGLSDKKAPEGGETLTAAQLSAKAHKMVEAGEAPDFVSAVSILNAKAAA